ncbi:MAG: peptidoglycan DD-metalloendopeptidase family protein [Methylotenera sp.]|uniref:peptidoglycan DD-metalloendopeptidase family protein n=1 Tax=Methylotenera sp. TaxID=2051956 RepID=UPI00248937EF|nr:peptidoglycan DD-metalloendopeptidase family protein [Methylotenera sp.]MDI1308395.1 peptidoglycan DD-metalloendopeptidase family protein [Methylotenera sp.]
MRITSSLICLAFLASCSSTPPAPVIDRLPNSKPTNTVPTATPAKKTIRPTYKAGDWRPDSYIVKKGDTLFSIGLEYGYYYKDIAQVNNISPPYNINVGQTLKLNALKDKQATAEIKPMLTTNSDGVEIIPINTDNNSSVSSTTSVAIKTPTIVAITEPKAIREPYNEEALKRPLPAAIVAEKATEKSTEKPVDKPSLTTSTTNKPVVTSSSTSKVETKPNVDVKANTDIKPSSDSSEDIDWAWPTQGKVVANFNEASNKGLDIAGTTGQAISAAANGKVIYSGSDLRGYGKLVIIKHNPNYLSVYAHNSLILVKEGQQVTKGQKIAEMGNTDSNTVKLHFEIRRQGKSVDPSKYLASN